LFIRKGTITLLFRQELEPARCPAGNRHQDGDTVVTIVRNPQDSNPQFRRIPNSQFGEFRKIPNSQFGEFPEFSKIPNSQFENLRDTQVWNLRDSKPPEPLLTEYSSGSEATEPKYAITAQLNLTLSRAE
jgi:hypothetical protein